MKFKRFLDLPNNNLFVSVFEKYYNNGFFGTIDRSTIRTQQLQWCKKICDLVENLDVDTLCECLESREAKTSREWISNIISDDILADSRAQIKIKLSKSLSNGLNESVKEKVKTLASDLTKAAAGDALIVGNSILNVAKKLGSNLIDMDSIKKAIEDFKSNFKRGASWFKEGDPFETKEFLERHNTGTLRYGTRTEKTQDGSIFEMAVGYDYGEFVGFLLLAKKDKMGQTVETSFIPVNQKAFEKILEKMDRNSINVVQKAIKINIGNKVQFIVRSHGDSIQKLYVDCDVKNKKCKVIEDKKKVLFEEEKFVLKLMIEKNEN